MVTETAEQTLRRLDFENEIICIEDECTAAAAWLAVPEGCVHGRPVCDEHRGVWTIRMLNTGSRVHCRSCAVRTSEIRWIPIAEIRLTP